MEVYTYKPILHKSNPNSEKPYANLANISQYSKHLQSNVHLYTT